MPFARKDVVEFVELSTITDKSRRVRWNRENAKRVKTLEVSKSEEEKSKAKTEMGYLAGNYLASVLKFRRKIRCTTPVGTGKNRKWRHWSDWEEEWRVRRYIHLHKVLDLVFMKNLSMELIRERRPIHTTWKFDDRIVTYLMFEGVEVEKLGKECPVLGAFCEGLLAGMGWKEKRFVDVTVVNSGPRNKSAGALHNNMLGYDKKEVGPGGKYPVVFWIPMLYDRGKSCASIRLKPPRGKRGKEPKERDCSVDVGSVLLLDAVELEHGTAAWEGDEMPVKRLVLLFHGDEKLRYTNREE